jgi:hypothetical protein
VSVYTDRVIAGVFGGSGNPLRFTVPVGKRLVLRDVEWVGVPQQTVTISLAGVADLLSLLCDARGFTRWDGRIAFHAGEQLLFWGSSSAANVIATGYFFDV